MLDNTKLGSSNVKVEAAEGIDQLASGKGGSSGETSGKDDNDLEQEDKPRSRILAEYMAHGYAIGDKTLQRAIELDSQHGFSSRFTSALHNFDGRLKATDRAKSADAAYGITDRALAGWRGLQSYFERALDTPTGQRVRAFYTQTEKQVMDIHNEARRLAELRKQEQGGSGGSGGGGSGQGSGEKSDSKDSQVPEGQSATGPAPDIAAASHLQPLGSNMPHEATGPAADIAADIGIAPKTDDYAGQRG